MDELLSAETGHLAMGRTSRNKLEQKFERASASQMFHIVYARQAVAWTLLALALLCTLFGFL